MSNDDYTAIWLSILGFGVVLVLALAQYTS